MARIFNESVGGIYKNLICYGIWLALILHNVNLRSTIEACKLDR